MVDRKLIKRILGQRTLAQSLLARHTLGVSGEMPGHPAFVAALAVIAPPAASATVFEQTPLDDTALAAFFAAPAAEQPPAPELRMLPALVANRKQHIGHHLPVVGDHGSQVQVLNQCLQHFGFGEPTRIDGQCITRPCITISEHGGFVGMPGPIRQIS